MSTDAPHPMDSAEAFERLARDPASTHARLVQVQADAEVWWEVLDRWPDLIAWVAANRHLPAQIVEHLAQHHSPQVRAALASSCCTHDSVMQQLAHDKSELIRLRVVCNTHTSRDVLVALTADPCPLVAAHAQARLVHDLTGVALPASYLDEVRVLDLLH